MLADKLYTPSGSPIRFFSSRDHQPDTYRAKYAPDDATDVQFCSLDAPLAVSLQMLNEKNRVIRTSDVRIRKQGDYNFYTATIQFTGFPEGLYRMRINALNAKSITTVMWSNLICVCEANRDLPLIHWNNSYNKESIDYSEVKFFSMRIEGGFLPKNYRPKSEQTQYQSQARRFITLFSETYSTSMFTAGVKGIPDSVHALVHSAFSCDNLYIDRIEYAKYEDAAWESSELDERYPFRNWTIEMVQNEGEMPDDWHDAWFFEFGYEFNPVINMDETGGAFVVDIISLKDGVKTGYTWTNSNEWIIHDTGDRFVINPNFDNEHTGTIVFTQNESGRTRTVTVTQAKAVEKPVTVEYAIDSTTGENARVAMPITWDDGIMDVMIDWGDGNFTVTPDKNIFHYYNAPGAYTAKFIPLSNRTPNSTYRIECDKPFVRERLTKILSWGSAKVYTAHSMCGNCTLLTYVAIDYYPGTGTSFGVFEDVTDF
ncbi:MAG: hypothetical protein LBF85_03735, partial [Tannerella sp.]|nr:hypothetical protein [Tannerella sp.]